MRRVCSSLLFVLLLISWGVADVRVAAQEAESEGLSARAAVVRPVAARNPEDATAAATTLDLNARPMALETLREVVPEVPGALPLARGSYGTFSSVSLRGTDLGHTVWLLGDVPLNGPDTGAFDISLLPVSQLASLEVYRGGAPVWLSQGSIGGAIRVVPRSGATTGAGLELGVGSFGLVQLRGEGQVRREGRRPLSLHTGLQATSSDGNFRYLDDRSTRLAANAGADDVTRRIRNADIADGTGLLHLRMGVARGHLDAIAYAIERVGGVPGAAGDANTFHARRRQRRGLIALAYTREKRLRGHRPYRVQLLASAQVEDRRLDDRYAEIGAGPSIATQTWLRGTARAAASYELTRFLEATGTLYYAGDRFETEEALRYLPFGPSTRHTQALAGELRLFGPLFGVRSELRGSVRGEWTQTSLETLQVGRAVKDDARAFSPVVRIATALSPLRYLTLRGSLGTGRRVPAISELFGDGATQKPNPRLVAERGRYIDAGLVITEAVGDVCLSTELNGFAQRIDDKILLVTTNQFESVAINQGRADIRGLELGLDVAYRARLRAVSAATLLDSENQLGLQLPRQPKLRLYGRIEGSWFPGPVVDRVTLFGTLDHVSTAYFDKANQSLRSPFSHVGFGASLALVDERLALSARVADVFDVRGQDFQRFPLPGRSFFFAISIREDES
jgi:iron complex outermembrane receptor protein